MERINSPDGLFHEGNPATGEKGTKVTAVWLNALQEEVIGRGGDTRAVSVDTVLLETDSIIFVDTSLTPVIITVPTYALVGPLKRYTLKRIGEYAATLICADGKTVDGEASLDLADREKITIAKDGTNWESI